MSEDLQAVDHDELKEVGLDYFGYHIREIQNLFSHSPESHPLSSQCPISSAICVQQEVDDVNETCAIKDTITVTGSSSFFSNGIGGGLSDFQKERLKTSLKQRVAVLSEDVHEMVDPVLTLSKIKKHLQDKERNSDTSSSDANVIQPPCKKQKLSCRASSTTSPVHTGLGSQRCGEGLQSEETGGKNSEAISSDESHIFYLKRSCSGCNIIDTPQWRSGPAGPNTLCDSCGTKDENNRTAPVDTSGVDETKREVNEDLLILLDDNGAQAKEIVKRHSDELYEKLNHMEQQLEELLDVVVSKCRPMTVPEKQKLRLMIQKLPPKNLDRVVEIVLRSRKTKEQPCNVIHIDLEKEDNATLWRLFYYVEAFSSARKASS